MITHGQKQDGFTLVEMMIAITVFSVLLLLSAATLTQISRLYYKGIIISKTQNVSRTVMDDISQSIQFSSGEKAISSKDDLTSVCIGNTRYTYVLNKQINQDNKHALWKDKVTGFGSCSANMPDFLLDEPSNDGIELLEYNMRLKNLSIGNPDYKGIFDVSVGIIYGDDDLINFSGDSKPISCNGRVTGSQWCASSELFTQVFSRVKQ